MNVTWDEKFLDRSESARKTVTKARSVPIADSD